MKQEQEKSNLWPSLIKGTTTWTIFATTLFVAATLTLQSTKFEQLAPLREQVARFEDNPKILALLVMEIFGVAPTAVELMFGGNLELPIYQSVLLAVALRLTTMVLHLLVMNIVSTLVPSLASLSRQRILVRQSKSTRGLPIYELLLLRLSPTPFFVKNILLSAAGISFSGFLFAGLASSFLGSSLMLSLIQTLSSTPSSPLMPVFAGSLFLLSCYVSLASQPILQLSLIHI
eukprot:TRINITY_DN4944_c0_g1_i4.p1 TRINITY_DN4944_c0_g1~~TRINITY_DN4944_c0_g1_i4.p1  ORF type:complete len:232 (-),score=17.52 TRINITY_DN4944_c0_g1_i4:61-756(-)